MSALRRPTPTKRTTRRTGEPLARPRRTRGTVPLASPRLVSPVVVEQAAAGLTAAPGFQPDIEQRTKGACEMRPESGERLGSWATSCDRNTAAGEFVRPRRARGVSRAAPPAAPQNPHPRGRVRPQRVGVAPDRPFFAANTIVGLWVFMFVVCWYGLGCLPKHKRPGNQVPGLGSWRNSVQTSHCHMFGELKGRSFKRCPRIGRRRSFVEPTQRRARHLLPQQRMPMVWLPNRDGSGIANDKGFWYFR